MEKLNFTFSCTLIIASLLLSPLLASEHDTVLPEDFDFALITLPQDHIAEEDETEAVLRGPNNQQSFIIKRDRIHAYAHRTTNNQFDSKKYQRQKSSHPSNVVNNICNTLTQHMEQKNISSLDQDTLDFILQIALNTGTAKAHTPNITYQKIDCVINECITEFFQNCDMTITNIPAVMKKEFLERKTACVEKIKEIMCRRCTSAIPYPECLSTVEKAYEGFIERAKHVLLWDWINAELANNKIDSPENKKQSSIKQNKASKFMREKINFKLKK